MKIVHIFAQGIYSIIFPDYEDKQINEFDRFLELWGDIEYLKSFFDENKHLIINNPFLGNIKTIHDFTERIYDEVEKLEIAIEESSDDGTLDELFEYLHRIDSLKKDEDDFKKIKLTLLRIYAIKIEDEYLITGGAIKITKAMQDHKDTYIQLNSLKEVKQFLESEGIIDGDSLLDFIDTQ